MKTRIDLVLMLVLALTLIGAALIMAQQVGAGPNVALHIFEQNVIKA